MNKLNLKSLKEISGAAITAFAAIGVTGKSVYQDSCGWSLYSDCIRDSNGDIVFRGKKGTLITPDGLKLEVDYSESKKGNLYIYSTEYDCFC